MFDVLVAALTLGSALVEGSTLISAVKSNGSDWKVSPVTNVSKTHKKGEYRLMHKAKSRQIEKRSELLKDVDQSSTNVKYVNTYNPIKEWVLRHDSLILSMVKTGGKHLITNDELGKIDVEALSDFLFTLDFVEMVDITNDGLIVVIR